MRSQSFTYLKFVQLSPQEAGLRPLQEILPSEWNALNRPPSMLDWLVAQRSAEDSSRIHALGNIVVPLQGKVGWHVLFQMQRDKCFN